MLNATNFHMTASAHHEFEALTSEDWSDLVAQCYTTKSTAFKQKDIIIMRLYLTFMGLDLAKEPDD